MKRFRWVIAVVVLLVLVAAWGPLHLYRSYMAEATDGRLLYEDWVLANTPISTILQYDRYHGNQMYHIFLGTNAEERKFYVLINEDEHWVVPYSAGYSIDQLMEQVKTSLAPANVEIRHVVPGREEGQLLYEVLAVDDKNQYHYLYYQYYTGENLKEIHLSQPWSLQNQ